MKNTIIALAVSAIVLSSANAQNFLGFGANTVVGWDDALIASAGGQTIDLASSFGGEISGTVNISFVGDNFFSSGNTSFIDGDGTLTIAFSDNQALRSFSNVNFFESESITGSGNWSLVPGSQAGFDVTSSSVTRQADGLGGQRPFNGAGTPPGVVFQGQGPTFIYTQDSPFVTARNAVALQVAAVPEPSSALLLGLGAFGLLGRRKR